MVGCAAVGCSNRSEQGYRMYGFPKNQERKKRWMAMVSRKDLQMTGASNNRKLCHVHFEDDQFTATKSRGNLKLRPDAVPTIFAHRPKRKRRKPPSQRVSEAAAPIQSTTDHTYHAKLNFETKGEIEVDFKGNEGDMPGDRKSDREATLPEAGDPGMCVPDSHSGASTEDTALAGPGAPGARLPRTDRATVEALKRQLKMEKLMRRRAERALAQQQIINAVLRKRNNLVSQKFTQMFNKDQIKALRQDKKRGIRWGKEMINKAIQIRSIAGAIGYKTLQQMQIPLPNIRTLQRKMQHVKLKSGQQPSLMP